METWIFRYAPSDTAAWKFITDLETQDLTKYQISNFSTYNV